MCLQCSLSLCQFPLARGSSGAVDGMKCVICLNWLRDEESFFFLTLTVRVFAASTI